MSALRENKDKNQVKKSWKQVIPIFFYVFYSNI